MSDRRDAGPSEIDDLWTAVCAGNQLAFAKWMGRVERPIRRLLEPYARAVDVEGVMQETLQRMWVCAQDRGRELIGENASLRWAIGMARNIARNEARKHGREILLSPENFPEPQVLPDPPSDPFLARIIRECLKKIAARPLAAMMARIERGHAGPDRKLAEALKMSLNTFLQNFTRARKQLKTCLEANGVPPGEFLQ